VPRARDVARRARKVLARRETPIVPAHVGRIDYEQAEILVGVTSRAEILSRLRPCAKEPWTVRWLEETLRTGDVLYDIGANVGSYSLIAAALRSDVRVIAVEPGYSSYAALCDNVLLNRRQDVVTPLPVALAEASGLRTLHYSDVAAGAAEHELRQKENSAYRQAVLAYRLDDLVEHFGLPSPTLVKLDVDGGEAAVLAGATQALARRELRSVLVEVERAHSAEAIPFLDRAGLVLRERIDERDGERLLRVWYGIFERPDQD
jgi:FkbM family methyltransferase